MPSATIVGAGVFGAWTAHALQRRGWKVTLLEPYGPGNSRSSSGGETRIIRSAYGPMAIYAQWARASLPEWRALADRAHETLFVPTGALFLGRNREWLEQTAATLTGEQIPVEWLSHTELARRYPQLAFVDAAGGVFEPDAGVLFARRAVQALVAEVVAHGARLRIEQANAAALIRTNRDDALVFATGAWLPRLFPELLSSTILPTRQEVFFFGPPPGDHRFSATRLPAWVAFEEGIYGIPDLEHRGVKVAIDAHGPEADPDSMDRMISHDSIARLRNVLRVRIPALADAPLIESRVCQYENTPDGHFLLDRHPLHDRVWIAGGGSGHGFKHGPAIGSYMADLIELRHAPDPLFALAGRPERRRTVY